MATAATLAISAYSAYSANKNAKDNRNAANNQADRAAALAQYEPGKEDYQDPQEQVRRERLDGLYGRSGDSTAFSSGQTNLAKILEDRVSGKTPSIAAAQLQAGQENAANQALGLAQQQGGGALALRGAINAGNQGALQTNQQAGIMRMQEESQNLGALGQVYQQGRAGDLGQNAQLLQIAQQQATEDERNRQALMARHKLIASGRQAAAGARSGYANQLAENSAASDARSSNLMSNFLTKGVAPALEKGYNYFSSNQGKGGVVGNTGYTASAPGTGSTAKDRRG